jgi:ATP/maltotriose-dependent transcriptional regulator MalT
MDISRTETTAQSVSLVTPSGREFPALAHPQSIAVPRIEGNGPDRSSVSLSTRELAIVFLMSDGLSNKQIARQFSISPETVKSHAKRIFVKLTVCSRAQAVYRAAALGLIALQ